MKKKRSPQKIYLTKMCLNIEVISVGFWDNGMLITYHCPTPIPNTHSRERERPRQACCWRAMENASENTSPAGISKEGKQGMAFFSKGPSPRVKIKFVSPQSWNAVYMSFQVAEALRSLEGRQHMFIYFCDG